MELATFEIHPADPQTVAAHSRLPPPSVDAAADSILTRGLLQASHRLATVAMLALLATGGFIFAGKDFWGALAAACGCADGGLCAALLTLSLVRRDRPIWREAVGVLRVNAVVAVVTLPLMLVARLDVIRDDVRDTGASARAAVEEFFTPPPALPPQ